ncbi:MAG: mitochondrial fission ELM1 family protein [Pseudomonadota bacterium]
MTENRNERAPTCWVVTDGRAGIEAQALGLAEAIADRTPLDVVRKRIRVRAPWGALPRAFLGDALSKLAPDSDGLDPPYPDLWIACGRASVPLTIAMKRKSPQTFTIQLQDPRAPSTLFDLVIAPAHDRLAGDNVFSIVGSTNRVARKAFDRATPRAGGGMNVAVLIGGSNRAFRLTPADAALIARQLAELSGTGAAISVTTSRRTPPAAAEALCKALKGVAQIIWRAGADDPKSNPYPAMLSDADFILVTEDSVNMATEAAATGKPVFVLRLRRKAFAPARKFDAFHESLRQRGVSKFFAGRLETWTYEPLDETARAADEAIRRWRESVSRAGVQ